MAILQASERTYGSEEAVTATVTLKGHRQKPALINSFWDVPRILFPRDVVVEAV